MDKETVFAWVPKSKEESEMMQRIAMSFGYKWAIGDVNCYGVGGTARLTFHAEDKSIKFGDGFPNAPTATSLRQALEYFKSHTKPATKEIPGAVLHADGHVTLSGGMLSGEAFDLLVATRNEFMEGEE